MPRPDDGTTPAELIAVVEHGRSLLALGYGDIARALSVDNATLYRWRTGASTLSPGARFRLSALREFLGELSRLCPEAEARAAWLDRPIPRFLETTPRELLLAGRVDLLTGYLVGLGDAGGDAARLFSPPAAVEFSE